MKARIIKVKGCKTSNELLLAIIRTGTDKDDYILMQAWHETADGPLVQCNEVTIDAGNHELMELFIEGFTELQAAKYLQQMEF